MVIPKIKGARDVKDFQPSSLTTTLYKIIVKVLSNRLEVVLAQVIEGNHRTFVHGRLIQDNGIIASEWIQEYKSKKEKSPVFEDLLGEGPRQGNMGFPGVCTPMKSFRP